MKNTYYFVARTYDESPYDCKKYYDEYKLLFSNKKHMIKSAHNAAQKIRKAIRYNCYIYIQIYKNDKYDGEIIIR